MQSARNPRRRARQGHIDAVLGQARIELGVLECLDAAADQLLERLPHRVGCLADPSALLRRQLADRAQRGGQLRLAAEVADPDVLQLLHRRRGCHVLLRGLADRFEVGM
jgi:hypothetical protein